MTVTALMGQIQTTANAALTMTAAAQTGPSLSDLQATARAALTGTAQGMPPTPSVGVVPTLVITEMNKAKVLSVAFSPTSPVLAYGSQGGQIYLWNLATGAVAATLEGHTGAVNSLAFSSDGRILASAGADGTIRLWNMATGAQIASLSVHDGAVNSVAFKPDGLVLDCGAKHIILPFLTFYNPWTLGQEGS